MTSVEAPGQVGTGDGPGGPPRGRRWWPRLFVAGLALAVVTAAVIVAVRQAADARVEVTTGWGSGLPDQPGGVAVDGAPSAHVDTPFGSATLVEFRDTVTIERLISLAHATDRTVTITDIDGVHARAIGLLTDEGGCQLMSTEAAVWVTAAGELPADARAGAAPFTGDLTLGPDETAFVWLTSTFDGTTCVLEGDPHVYSWGFLVDHAVRGTEGISSIQLDRPLWFVPDLDGFLEDAVEVTRRG